MTTIPSHELLNLTSYNIFVYPETPGAKLIVYPRSGTVARLATAPQSRLGALADGCPVYEPQRFVSISPTKPAFTDSHVGVIVSMPVAAWLSRYANAGEWRRIYCADLGPDGAVCDEYGIIIGTKRLVAYSYQRRN